MQGKRFISGVRRTQLCALASKYASVSNPNLAILILGNLRFGRVSLGAVVPKCYLFTSASCDRQCAGDGGNKLVSYLHDNVYYIPCK